jgi:hypothetical protein
MDIGATSLLSFSVTDLDVSCLILLPGADYFRIPPYNNYCYIDMRNEELHNLNASQLWWSNQRE